MNMHINMLQKKSEINQQLTQIQDTRPLEFCLSSKEGAGNPGLANSKIPPSQPTPLTTPHPTSSMKLVMNLKLKPSYRCVTYKFSFTDSDYYSQF